MHELFIFGTNSVYFCNIHEKYFSCARIGVWMNPQFPRRYLS